MDEKEMRQFAKIWFEEEGLYRARTQVTREELQRESELHRQETFKKIMQLAKANLPMDYRTFVFLVYRYLNVLYLENKTRGVYMREVDALVGLGKLCKADDGILSLPH
jgi:hypothetical protein